MSNYLHTQEQIRKGVATRMKNRSYKQSEETKLKRSQTLKKVFQTPESKQKRSNIMKKRWLNPKYRVRMEERFNGKNHPLYGKHPSEETLNKMKKSHEGKTGFWKGKHRSEETKNKLRLANLGKKHSNETKKKISLGNKGKFISKETRQKLSLLHKGKKKSPEQIAKLTATRIGKSPSQETREKLRRSLLGKRNGKDNPAWKGGISFEPYAIDWNETLKRSIRERDKYTCQLCGEPQKDKTLSVHHIDYNKKNCNPNNLISLCQTPCHIKTNANRKNWENYFKKLMELKYVHS